MSTQGKKDTRHAHYQAKAEVIERGYWTEEVDLIVADDSDDEMA